jgi:gluconolactonase
VPLSPDNSRSTAGLNRVVAAGASPEQVVTGFEFVEGPVWQSAQQTLVFSDIIGNTMYRWSNRDGLNVFRQPSNMANGNCWDRQGRLLSCEHATSRVCRRNNDNRIEVLASHYQGLELNSPNDIVVKRDGQIFFTDPNPGRTARFGVERDQELDFQGVFRLDPVSLELTLLIDDFSKPNGLCFSVDESRLFVNDTDRQHIRVFDVLADNSIANGRLWAETGGAEEGVADGMKVDSAGNLYSCGSGGIHVFDHDGERLGIIRVPEVPANFTWGGDNLTELFITARKSVYRLDMAIPGHLPFTPGDSID